MSVLTQMANQITERIRIPHNLNFQRPVSQLGCQFLVLQLLVDPLIPRVNLSLSIHEHSFGIEKGRGSLLWSGEENKPSTARSRILVKQSGRAGISQSSQKKLVYFWVKRIFQKCRSRIHELFINRITNVLFISQTRQKSNM